MTLFFSFFRFSRALSHFNPISKKRLIDKLNRKTPNHEKPKKHYTLLISH